jgi:hypothetical protein
LGNSWDHQLEQLSVRELFRLARRDADTAARFGDDFRLHGECSIGRVTHREPATYEHSYSYVTGRSGRVSWAAKLICGQHAEKTARQYGIDLASVPVQRQRAKHASEQAFEQLFGGGAS